MFFKDYLKSFFEAEAYNIVAKGLEKSGLLDALICCTHFTRVSYSLEVKHLAVFFHRRAGIIAKDNQGGYDFMFPLLKKNGENKYVLRDENMTAFVVQIKNRETAVTYQDALTDLQEKKTKLGLGSNVKYVTMYLNVNNCHFLKKNVKVHTFENNKSIDSFIYITCHSCFGCVKESSQRKEKSRQNIGWS